MENGEDAERKHMDVVVAEWWDSVSFNVSKRRESSDFTYFGALWNLDASNLNPTCP